MTFKELWQWAVDNSIEDYEISIQYCDDGGYYSGSRDLKEYEIEVNHNEQEVIL